MYRFFISAVFLVAAEASMRGHSMSWYTMGHVMTEDPPKEEKKEEIPVDGSALSEPVKAVTYKSKPVSAPDQGFEGGDVAHAHMKTTTGDWGAEYGPEAWWLKKKTYSGAAQNFISMSLIAGFVFFI